MVNEKNSEVENINKCLINWNLRFNNNNNNNNKRYDNKFYNIIFLAVFFFFFFYFLTILNPTQTIS